MPDPSIPDPFDRLRLPDDPIHPPVAFANRLRSRLERALGLTPSVTAPGAPMMNTVTPYLCCKGAAAALDFYVEVFGAVEVGQRYVDQADGRIGHAEFELGGNRLSIADEYPEVGAVSPATLGGSPVSFSLIVDDVDRVYERAVAAGAQGQRPPEDQAYGMRAAWLLDPWGHRWTIQVPLHVPARAIDGFDLIDVPMTSNPADVTEPAASTRSAALLAGPAQLGYFTIATRDVARASAFYGGVLGWDVDPSGHIGNIDPPGGLMPPDRWTSKDEHVLLYFQVSDLDAVCARVVASGGEVRQRATYESGGNASCIDDQGTAFELFQPNPGYERH